MCLLLFLNEMDFSTQKNPFSEKGFLFQYEVCSIPLCRSSSVSKPALAGGRPHFCFQSPGLRRACCWQKVIELP